jgi:hypothetical protein
MSVMKQKKCFNFDTWGFKRWQNVVVFVPAHFKPKPKTFLSIVSKLLGHFTVFYLYFYISILIVSSSIHRHKFKLWPKKNPAGEKLECKQKSRAKKAI